MPETTEVKDYVIEEGVITVEDLARAREIEFTQMFSENVKKLMEALGVTRKIAKQAGSVLKLYKASGELEDGDVPEGAIIPLSKYVTEPVPFDEIKLKKWRKATSAEAIEERGFDQAVQMTTDRMLKDVQKGIRADFFSFLAEATKDASAEKGDLVTGSGLQAKLAKSWGRLQILFEDDEIQSVFFVNPSDVADYLATAQISTQTAFGMTYVQNFLGMGTLILNSSVPAGTVYSTAADNIILYYAPVNGNDLAKAFAFTTDETGYVGIHEKPNYDNMTSADVVVCGMVLLVERADGIVKATNA